MSAARGILVRNPAALVKSLGANSDKKLQTLAAEQVSHLRAATDAHCYGIAWRLAVLGLRRGEILALRWDTIDFDVTTLSVTAARLATAGGPTTGAPKTKTSVRTLPMPDDLTAAWRKARSNAGLPHIRPHDARHSCATLMHLKGVPTVVIAAWLGHADPGFPRIYAHSTNDALADAGAILGSITTGKKKDAKSLDDVTYRVSPSSAAGGIRKPACHLVSHQGSAQAPQRREKPPVTRWFSKWPGPGSNRRPSAFQADARTN